MLDQIHLVIRELRTREGITQKELGKVIGVSFQTISKWENGITMPDISYLPPLAKYFGVSVDVLLGLEHLEEEQRAHRFDKEYWETQIERTKHWKLLFWNDDYIEFLITRVWKIKEPIDILDLGCGYGYIGLKFLPFLPLGSTYTGLELSEVYIREGKKQFAKTSYKAKFIQTDLYDFQPKEKYDIVITSMMLSYLSKPQEILDKMKESAKEKGMVVGIDINLEMEQSGTFTGLENGNTPIEKPDYKKVWKWLAEKREQDYRMGTKLPFLLRQMGLKNVQARLSDRIFLWDSQELTKAEDKEKYQNQFESFRHISLDDDAVKEGYSYYLERGVSWNEIDYYLQYNKKLKQYLDKEDIFVARPSCLVVAWGYSSL